LVFVIAVHVFLVHPLCFMSFTKPNAIRGCEGSGCNLSLVKADARLSSFSIPPVEVQKVLRSLLKGDAQFACIVVVCCDIKMVAYVIGASTVCNSVT